MIITIIIYNRSLMITNAITRLSYLCQVTPPLLLAIEEAEFSAKPSPNKWSKKQIVGHLIDSATNNHQRFVRTQFEEAPTIVYDQNKWNTFSYYEEMPGLQSITFWEAYNRQLLELIQHIPPQYLQRECTVGNGEKVTLAFLINDYVAHLEHHLQQVISY